MRRRSVLALGGATLLVPGALAADVRAPGPIRKTVWKQADRRFGGISALHLSEDGRRAMAVSDRGLLFDAEVVRDTGGWIARIEVTATHPLLGLRGEALVRERADAEGIAVAPDGTIFIAFEGEEGSRVWAYDVPGGPARALPQHPAFRRLEGNGGLEALAINAAGALFTLPETPEDKGFPVFRFDGSVWDRDGTLPALGGFVPVSADFGPDGRFYLLERRFRLPLRFANRLRRFAPGDWERGETLLETRLSQFDNHEALSVTMSDDGRLRATMVSDDNFLKFQRTEVLELVLPD